MGVKQLIAGYLEKEGVDTLLEAMTGLEQRFSYRKPPVPKDRAWLLPTMQRSCR